MVANISPRRFRIPPSSLSELAFVELYGGIYEHSPHFAIHVYRNAPHAAMDTLAQLSAAFRTAVEASNHVAQLSLIKAHPDLADRVRRTSLTAASAREQAGAGLDGCTSHEFEAFMHLNDLYKRKFGFPFIKAVRGFSRAQILDEFRNRLANDEAREFATALEEIHKIALLRLSDLMEQD